MKIALTIFYSFLAYIISCQEHPYAIKFSHEIQLGVKDQSIRPSTAGTLFSFIGDYYNSVNYSEIQTSWGVDTLDVSQFQLSDAFDAIIERASTSRVVIISENHLKPQHRIFAKKIILALKEIGYDHLGLEALSPLDSFINQRGYPLNHPKSGVYTMEPQMNKLILSALQSKINVFGYEALNRDKTRDRDEIHADNIIERINLYPDSKFIILCGFHHVIESDLIKRGDSFWMARYIKEKTGIDPLTVYQDNFTEKFKENEHPLLRKIAIEEPATFINDEGEIAALTKQVDIEVIHPKTYTIRGRPNWLFENNNVAVKIDKVPKLGYPQIVAAYHENFLDAPPFDRIELKHEYDNRHLVLEPGIYTIKFTDGINHYEYIKKVK